jgi:hypothetical protein
VTVSKANERMPCPRCGKQHERGDYQPRPELADRPLGDLLKGKDGKPYPEGHKLHGVRSGTPFAPPDVRCGCGALLRHTVPIFASGPYGWHWRIL